MSGESDYIFLKVKVFPDSKKERYVGNGENEFEIRVREKAKEGKADKRVKE